MTRPDLDAELATHPNVVEAVRRLTYVRRVLNATISRQLGLELDGVIDLLTHTDPVDEGSTETGSNT